jgi:hypothetical protein
LVVVVKMLLLSVGINSKSYVNQTEIR